MITFGFKAEYQPSDIEIERRNRIRVAMAAYAYELEDDPIMSDAEYDQLALRIRPQLETGHAVLDRFFREEFSPHTGLWVRNHPEKEKLKQQYQSWKKRKDP